MKLYHAVLNIHPPPPSSSVTAIHKELAVMAAREVCASMDRAKKELEARLAKITGQNAFV